VCANIRTAALEFWDQKSGSDHIRLKALVMQAGNAVQQGP